MAIAVMAENTCEIGILFGDVAGSTGLYEALGDEAALRAVALCLSTMNNIAVRHGGSPVKTIGDEVMVAFADASAMFEAAMAMQRAVGSLPPIPGAQGPVRLQVRIGMHFGHAIVKDDDLFGDSVNIAARMVRIARGDQIIMGSDMAGLLRPDQLQATRSLTVFPVRGRAQATEIIEVLWQELPGTTVIHTRPPQKQAAPRHELRLTYAGVDHVFDSTAEVALGRGPENKIVVPHHRVSRKHATIGCRRERWVLTDHSTNGTFITFAGERELSVHIDELALHNSGIIALGLPAESGGECVRFEVFTAGDLERPGSEH